MGPLLLAGGAGGLQTETEVEDLGFGYEVDGDVEVAAGITVPNTTGRGDIADTACLDSVGQLGGRPVPTELDEGVVIDEAAKMCAGAGVPAWLNLRTASWLVICRSWRCVVS